MIHPCYIYWNENLYHHFSIFRIEQTKKGGNSQLHNQIPTMSIELSKRISSE